MMDEDQTKDDVCYTKEQETATRNIIALGAVGMDVEHVIGTMANGAATETVSPENHHFASARCHLQSAG